LIDVPPKSGRPSSAAAVVALTLFIPIESHSQSAVEPPERPAILFNRWQEDWSVLADPRVEREPLDELKYIPLSSSDPKTYLSLGADVRERYEFNDAANFGVGKSPSQSYVISRLESHIDLRATDQLQAFVQLQSDYAIDKAVITPVDQNRLDLEQAFFTITEPIADGHFKFRLGRQQFGFDLQRFVSVRDGPNVRQSYDAIWADYEQSLWRFITFYSYPVQSRNLRAFDDYSGNNLTYGGFRAERKITDSSALAVYYSVFKQANARFLSAHGSERRDILDAHYSGKEGHLDWDAEVMGQEGHIGAKRIRAWGFGSLAGYTFDDVGLTPRLGLQFDAASGEHKRSDGLETFNPLFPNGYYVTLAGYTGYVNFVHLKPSMTLHFGPSLQATVAAAAQWRQTTADAVYTQPNIPVAGTAGRPGAYTGTYGQLRVDWSVTRSMSAALEAVHFQVADVIRSAGGRDSDYVGIQYSFGW
jgi:hypothetical protein